MKFCKEHWQALRAAVQVRGMDHLVAKNGAQAVNDAVAQLQGTDSLENWDPLMAAYWAISGRVLQAVGLPLLMGDHCPLCLVQQDYETIKQTPRFDPALHTDATSWINSCTDSMQQYARQHGLIPQVQ